eukprot:3390055-Lingulodinium_polyedra.AAC.1
MGGTVALSRRSKSRTRSIGHAPMTRGCAFTPIAIAQGYASRNAGLLATACAIIAKAGNVTRGA